MAAALTAKDVSVYDRQIRLWGVEGQQRIQSSRVLLAGKLGGAMTEVAKNLVLAGMKLSLSDSGTVEEADLGCNFFLRPSDVGTARDAAAAGRVQELNPLSDVQVLPTPLLLQGAPDLAKTLGAHSLLLLGDAGPSTPAIAAAARSAGCAVIVLHTAGELALAQLDLGPAHAFKVETAGKEGQPAPAPRRFTAAFPSIAEGLAARVPATKKVRRAGAKYAAFLALRAAMQGGGDAQDRAVALAGEFGLPPDTVDASTVSAVVRGRGAESPAASALTGGLLAVEVVKAVQGKGAPSFCFLVMDGRTGDSRAVDTTSSLHRYEPAFVCLEAVEEKEAEEEDVLLGDDDDIVLAD